MQLSALCVWLQRVDELAEIAVMVHHQQGQHDKALEAASLIRSLSRREAKLRIHGYWREVADLIQVQGPSSLFIPGGCLLRAPVHLVLAGC